MPAVVNVRMRAKFPCAQHVTEPTYGEIVHVRNGECTVKYQTTVDALLGRGYEIVKDVPPPPPKVVARKVPKPAPNASALANMMG